MKRFPVSGAYFFLILLLAAPGALWAQDSPRGNGIHVTHSAARKDPSGGSFLTAQTVNSQNLAAAEQEDDTAVYRHSASVRALGRLLHLGPEEAARLFEYLNFGILFGAIFVILLKYLPKLFLARQETIARQITEARTATRESTERLKQVEQKLSKLDEEIAAIRARAEAETAEDAVRMKALIEKERQRIVNSAEQEIAAAAEAARRQLKQFAGELAVERAIAKIKLSEEQDELLLQQFSEGLMKQARGGGLN